MTGQGLVSKPEGQTKQPEGLASEPEDLASKPEGPPCRRKSQRPWRSPRGLPPLVLVLHVLVLQALWGLGADGASTVSTRHVSALTVPCSHPSALEAVAGSKVMSASQSRGPLDCLTRCSGQGLCHVAAHVQQASGSGLGLCVLLGALGGSNSAPLAQWETGPSTDCTVIILNPCLNGGTFVRGLCVCPAGFTGLTCQLTKPAECAAAWQEVWATDAAGGTVRGSQQAVDDMGLAYLGSNLRVRIHEPDLASSLLVGGSYFKPGAVVQTRPSLRKAAWNQLDGSGPAVREFQLVKGTSGTVQLMDDATGTRPTRSLAVQWFARLPYVPQVLHGGGVGSLDGLLQALAAGHSLLTFNAVYFNNATRLVAAQRFQWELGANSASTLQTYFFDSKREPHSSRANVFRYNLVSDSFRSIASSSGSYDLYEDPCWTPAGSYRLGRQPDIGHVMAAILNGHRVRIIADDVSLEAEQVLVKGDVVAFGAAPYLDPVTPGPFSSTSQAVRLVAYTDGTVRTCSTLPPAGQPFHSTNVSAASLAWFVDTRTWSRALRTDTEGNVLQGSLADLLSAVKAGARVQIGLTFPQPDSYLLLAMRSMEVTSAGHVAAQVFGLSREDAELCNLRAYLVTSEGDVRVLDYKHRESGGLSSLAELTIDWFVDSVATA